MRNKLIAALLAIASVAFGQGISGGGSGGGGGSVTGVTATAPLTSSGGAAPVIAATYQGNGAKVQASTGTATSGHAVKFDANGNTIDAGAAPVTQDGSGNVTINGGIVTGNSSGLNGTDYLAGSTSGGAGWSVANVAGTAVVYIIPTAPGATGQLLEDTGSATCPTNLPATITAITTLCHQLTWFTVSGAGHLGAQLQSSGTQTITTSTFTTVTLGTVVRDDGGFSGTANTLTVPAGKSGWYANSAQADWDSNTAGNRQVQIWQNGAALNSATMQTTAATGGFTGHSVNTVMFLTAGDTLTVKVYQASGGNQPLDQGNLSLAFIN